MKDKRPLKKLSGNSGNENQQINNIGTSPNGESAALIDNDIHKPDFNQDPLNLTLFQAYYRKSYNLVFKIVENFIFNLDSENNFEVTENENYKHIVNAIHNYFSLKIFEKIRTDKTLDNKLEKYESDTHCDEKTEIYYKHILQFHTEEYIQLIRTFSLFFLKKNQKDIMQKLGIYNHYKPSGSKKEREIKIIYSSIPFTQERLIKENLGVIEGKSDTRAAVFETIKRLEDSNNIDKSKYNPEEIYESYLQSNKNKPYQELIEENIKKLDGK
jgi:hypothetical protein